MLYIIVLVGNKVCSKQSQSSDTFHLEGSHFTSWELHSLNFLEILRHNQFISNLCHLTFCSFGESTEEKKNVFRGIQLVLQLPALCHYSLCETTENRSIIITVSLKKMFPTTHIFFACLTHFFSSFYIFCNICSSIIGHFLLLLTSTIWPSSSDL